MKAPVVWPKICRFPNRRADEPGRAGTVRGLEQAARGNSKNTDALPGRIGDFRIFLILICLLGAAVLLGCEGSPDEVDLEMPELSSVSDGVYQATASVPPVIARVEITVSSGRITDFRIRRHLTGQGRTAEILADRVVQQQTIQLDAVSGATYSSKAILKAGEKALRRGIRP
jgi:uncharacterized protein with FMN-binding domain